MTKKQVMEILEKVRPIASIYDNNTHGYIAVDIHDFDGFDDDWNEILVDYDEDLEDEIREELEKACDRFVPGFYDVYQFDGFYVRWGYESYDI